MNISAEEYATILDNIAHDRVAINFLGLQGKELSDEDCEALAHALSQNTTMERLNLSFNTISDRGVEYLAPVIKNHPALERVSLSYNRINDRGCFFLAECLHENNRIKVLALRFNFIGNRGARALAEVLKENTSLTLLSLGENRLRDEGALTLALALEVNKTLETLDLSMNQIENKGTIGLCRSLLNSPIKTFYYSANAFGDDGVAAFSILLEHNSSMQILNLSGNHINTLGVDKLKQGLIHNTTLMQLELLNNSCYDDVGQHLLTLISNLLKRNALRKLFFHLLNRIELLGRKLNLGAKTQKNIAVQDNIDETFKEINETLMALDPISIRENMDQLHQAWVITRCSGKLGNYLGVKESVEDLFILLERKDHVSQVLYALGTLYQCFKHEESEEQYYNRLVRCYVCFRHSKEQYASDKAKAFLKILFPKVEFDISKSITDIEDEISRHEPSSFIKFYQHVQEVEKWLHLQPGEIKARHPAVFGLQDRIRNHSTH